MQLFFVTLTDNSTHYVYEVDEFEAKYKVNGWLRKRFIGGSPVSIAKVQLMAEEGAKGHVHNLIV